MLLGGLWSTTFHQNNYNVTEEEKDGENIYLYLTFYDNNLAYERALYHYKN